MQKSQLKLRKLQITIKSLSSFIIISLLLMASVISLNIYEKTRRISQSRAEVIAADHARVYCRSHVKDIERCNNLKVLSSESWPLGVTDIDSDYIGYWLINFRLGDVDTISNGTYQQILVSLDAYGKLEYVTDGQAQKVDR
ncbi:hypothetical protein IPG36_05250 [bacterium]|nr:MAG: hypothetical protein IPG36_05250 [bacterium]